MGTGTLCREAEHKGPVTMCVTVDPPQQNWEKVSAGTVHESTARCWRELSPQTPKDKPAAQTVPHSRETPVLGARMRNVRVVVGDSPMKGQSQIWAVI